MSIAEYGEAWHIEVEDADGTIRKLHLTRPWGTPVQGNFGSPLIEHEVDETLQGHVWEYLGYKISPREIGFKIVRKTAGTRLEFWAQRAELLDFLRPNQFKPAKLILSRGDGQRRALTIYPDPGAPFPPKNTGDWTLDEDVVMTAFDPFWFDPDPVVITNRSEQNVIGGSGFRFPIRFPIRFTAGSSRFESAIDYGGSQETYPKITVTGQYHSLVISSTAHHAVIEMLSPLASNVQRIIDCHPNVPNLLDADGIDRWHEASEKTNLADFRILPKNLAPRAQMINIIALGSDNQMSVKIEYMTRYYGL